jgi:ArsR family transcriptional regulator
MEKIAAADPLPALRGLADPSRLRLLRLLDRAELSVGELARATGIAQSGVSRHLAALRDAGIAAERSEGARTYARVAPRGDAVPPVVAAVLAHVRSPSFGHEEDLRRLDAVLRAREADRADRFDELAGDWDALRAELLGGGLAPAEVASLLAPDGLRIVDAGSGTGVHLPWLAAVAGPSGRVLAVERSAEMAARAASRAEGLANVEVRRGRIEDLPVEDGWADALVLSLSLGWTADPAAALARCVRAVRAGGRVVVADVEAHGDRTLVARLGRGFAGFAPETLLAHLRAAGLEGVRRVEAPASARAAGPEARAPRLRPIRRLTPLLAVGTVPAAASRTRRNRSPR